LAITWASLGGPGGVTFLCPKPTELDDRWTNRGAPMPPLAPWLEHDRLPTVSLALSGSITIRLPLRSAAGTPLIPLFCRSRRPKFIPLFCRSERPKFIPLFCRSERPKLIPLFCRSRRLVFTGLVPLADRSKRLELSALVPLLGRSRRLELTPRRMPPAALDCWMGRVGTAVREGVGEEPREVRGGDRGDRWVPLPELLLPAAAIPAGRRGERAERGVPVAESLLPRAFLEVVLPVNRGVAESRAVSFDGSLLPPGLLFIISNPDPKLFSRFCSNRPKSLILGPWSSSISMANERIDGECLVRLAGCEQ
jgi:hypothetical protein